MGCSQAGPNQRDKLINRDSQRAYSVHAKSSGAEPRKEWTLNLRGKKQNTYIVFLVKMQRRMSLVSCCTYRNTY